jgi:Zinc carboxypeptidase
MRPRNHTSRITGRLLLAGLLSLSLQTAFATRTFGQGPVTSPLEAFGFNLGDDYQLANYTQLTGYWQTLARESDRITLEVIGETAEGRPIYMALVTSPENQRRLERYKEISRQLALAGSLSKDQARALAAEGKAVVWIDGGLHANETLGAQQLIELVYQMASRTDEETLRFLDDTILLAVCTNPDGLELVADWYMSEPVPERRSLENLPRLYQKYAGHDNNRDFYMSSQPETVAVNRVLYREWFPQIVYNHHQSGPRGTVLFAPPFRDPFNYNIDPLIVTSLDLVSGAMHTRFLAEDKPGATMRSGGNYSTWWNGGLRTSPYFHNMIGLLTETIGSPTPSRIPFDLDLQLPRGDYPAPVSPGVWHFVQSVAYSITANRAVLDFASRYRDTLLFNIWRMGMNSIERGSGDYWTLTPSDIARAETAGPGDSDAAEHLLRTPASRDPRGYVIPSDQVDFPTATRFVNALILNGVTVEQAVAPFAIGETAYPAGSYVVRTQQAFRPQVLDMFEPQDHPDDFAYPGAPPTPPYDTTGWTLAYQMGIRFDRILDGFDGPFQALPDVVRVPPGEVVGSGMPAGFFLSHGPNDAFAAVNRLLGEGDEVFWLSQPVTIDGRVYPEGTIYVRSGATTGARLDEIALGTGLHFEGVANEPDVDALRLRPVRIGLWDEYGGSEASGWTRFVLESFDFPFEAVYAPRLDAGELPDDFDVLIFPDGAIPAVDRRGPSVVAPGGEVGEAWRSRIGRVTIADTVPRLGEFLSAGGTVLSVGSSTTLARHLELPVENALAGLGSEEFYIPGSILRMTLDATHPLSWGMASDVDVFFDESPAFRLSAAALQAGIRPVASFPAHPLRSGWAWGEGALEDLAAVVDVPVGAGRLVLIGPEVTFRSQSHGAFKLLFNSIYYGSAVPVRLGR